MDSGNPRGQVDALGEGSNTPCPSLIETVGGLQSLLGRSRSEAGLLARERSMS